MSCGLRHDYELNEALRHKLARMRAEVRERGGLEGPFRPLRRALAHGLRVFARQLERLSRWLEEVRREEPSSGLAR
ncbi:hypothetical protein [Oceanithermus sp.]